MQNSSPAFSVIIPVYNEEENITELYRRLTSVMEILGTYEIIMIDDGSTDNSWHLIRDLHKSDSRVKGISFSRNFGHHIAITAGLDHAEAEAIVIMDGDLQDPPEEIPKLYNKLKQGYDLVCGIRESRSDSLYRKILSFLFWLVFKTFLRLDITKNQSMLRIMNKRYLSNFKQITERNRFLAGLFAWAGFNQATVQIEHATRFAGKSKYNTWKMIKLTFNAITSFSYFPLQLAGVIGLFISVSSFVFGIWLIIRKLYYDIDVAGWASTMVAILFMGGVQLAFLGIIGEYIGRIFTEVQRRPLYMIKEKVDDSDKT